MRKTFLFVVMLALVLPTAASAKKKKKKVPEPEPAAEVAVEASAEEMRAAVLKFLDVSGGLDGADVALHGMIEQFRQMHPEVPAALWDQFLAEVDLEEFANLIAPVYEKHFTYAEIQDAIGFYGSTTGLKFARLAPQLTTEGMAVGQVWGMELAERAMEVVQAEQAQTVE